MNQETKRFNDNITELGITRTLLKNKNCSKCQQQFTDEEIGESNFTLFFSDDSGAETNTYEKATNRLTL